MHAVSPQVLNGGGSVLCIPSHSHRSDRLLRLGLDFACYFIFPGIIQITKVALHTLMT